MAVREHQWLSPDDESLEDTFQDIQADFDFYYQQEKQMASLFPTFLSLGKRFKRLLASDIKSIWQALELPQDRNQAFYDGFLYHPID